jgi:hypothetical protein
MTKYTVQVRRVVRQYVEVEVEADSPEEIDEALDAALEDAAWIDIDEDVVSAEVVERARARRTGR